MSGAGTESEGGLDDNTGPWLHRRPDGASLIAREAELFGKLG